MGDYEIFPGGENWGNKKLGNVNWVMDENWLTKNWGMKIVEIKLGKENC